MPGKRANLEPTFVELRDWCRAVERGTFASAGADLNVTGNAVQAMVERLDRKVREQYNIKERLYVFDPVERKIRATAEGRRLYDLVVGPVAELEGALNEFGKLRQGEQPLRVAASLALWEHWLLRLVGQMRGDFKALSLRLFSHGSDGCLQLLKSHQCHLAFIGRLSGHVYEPIPQRARTKRHLWRKVPLALFVPSSAETGYALHADSDFCTWTERARRGKKGALAEVMVRIRNTRALILPGTFSQLRRQLDSLFVETLGGVGLDPREVQEFDVGRTILTAVAAELGVSIQQKWSREVPSGVEAIDLSGILPEWEVSVVWDPLYLSEPARHLLSAIGAKPDRRDSRRQS